METFNGKLTLAADPASEVSADVEVSGNRLIVWAAGNEIGTWDLTTIRIQADAHGFRFNADGEELVLSTSNDGAFAKAVGVEPYKAEPARKPARSGLLGRMRRTRRRDKKSEPARVEASLDAELVAEASSTPASQLEATPDTDTQHPLPPVPEPPSPPIPEPPPPPPPIPEPPPPPPIPEQAPPIPEQAPLQQDLPPRLSHEEPEPEPPAPHMGRAGGTTSEPRFDVLRSRSAITYVDDDRLKDVLVLAVFVASVFMLLGSVLPWADGNLIRDPGFPLGRTLSGIAGGVGIVGAYLGWRLDMREVGSIAAGVAALFTLFILYIFASNAGMRIGFFLVFVGTLTLGVLAVVSYTEMGEATDRKDR